MTRCGRAPRPAAPAAGRTGLIAARVLAVTGTLALVILSLAACHPLVNPVDPNSANYTGVPTNTDPGTDPATLEPVLPEAVKWESVMVHAGRALPLVIPAAEDPVFVEPRNGNSALGNTDPITIHVTFAEPFTWDDAKDAKLWYALADPAGEIHYGYEPISEWQVAPELRRIELVDLPIPHASILRLRIQDRTGAVVGERLIGRLIGDADQDEVVETGLTADEDDDWFVESQAGFSVSLERPATVSADLDLNGVVEPGGGDTARVLSYDTNTLPSTIPQFWD
jgi:hypothetical protein